MEDFVEKQVNDARKLYDQYEKEEATLADDLFFLVVRTLLELFSYRRK